jgi:PAS domain S-box-containing protein
MKIVLSRKGFDAVNGGRPSPILSDGSLLPLPIPDLSETSGITYGDIDSAHDGSIGDIVEDLTKQRVRRGHFAHLDPDLRRSAYPRLRGWQPLFGQAGGDQTHLERQGVTLGDLFLFFGWFREVEIVNERYRYLRNAPNLHVIYGWLQIGRILRLPTAHVPRWAEYHHHFHPPSSSGNWIDNTVYVSTPRLMLNGSNHETHGGGVFARYNEQLRLTCPDQRNRTLWKLPIWFYPRDGRSPLSRHGNRNRWKLEGDYTILDSVDLGQEFVFDADEYPEAIPWVRQLMTLAAAEDEKVMNGSETHHETASTACAKRVEPSEVFVVTSERKQNGDVSQQDLQLALQQSRESEARLRKIIDTIPALAWCNLSDGSNDFVNQRWSDYTGLSQEEVKRVGCKVAIHPEDLPKWLDQWRALIASGAGGEIEARLRRHDGAYRWFLIRVEPLLEESGEILRWYGTNTDIEDRKRTEEKLREDEREIRRITDAIPQTIMVQNPSGVPIYANQALLDYTGLTIDDVLASDFRARGEVGINFLTAPFAFSSELAANACLIEETLSEISNCICPEIRPRLRTPLLHNESDDHSTDGTQDKDRCVGFGDDGVWQA